MKFILPVLLCAIACCSAKSLKEGAPEVVEPEHLDMLLKEERYDEFNRLMGIDIPHLSKARKEDATGDARFNQDLYHGDILLTPKQKEQGRQGVNFTTYSGSKWKNGLVPYVIATTYTEAQRNVILKCISQFNTVALNCIRLAPRGTEADYIYFFSGDGCYSNLGRIGGQQLLSLAANGCLYVGTCLHEIEHAIGFLHEQNRPDRDSYLKILWNNIKSEWQSQFEKGDAQDFGIQGPYDANSIMHYPQKHPDVSNNLPAFEIFDKSVNVSKVGYGQAFTDIDKQKIKKLYCPA